MYIYIPIWFFRQKFGLKNYFWPKFDFYKLFLAKIWLVKIIFDQNFDWELILAKIWLTKIFLDKSLAGKIIFG